MLQKTQSTAARHYGSYDTVGTDLPSHLCVDTTDVIIKYTGLGVRRVLE